MGGEENKGGRRSNAHWCDFRYSFASERFRMASGNRAGPTLHDCDLILHAGDFKTLEVIDHIRELAPFEGVAGNVDPPEIVEALGKRKTLTCAGYRIGLVHGDGKKKTTLDRAWEAFAEEEKDVIVFGHSHIPYLGVKNGVLMLNPGSPTDKRKNPQFSYAVLELGALIEPEIRYFD